MRKTSCRVMCMTCPYFNKSKPDTSVYVLGAWRAVHKGTSQAVSIGDLGVGAGRSAKAVGQIIFYTIHCAFLSYGAPVLLVKFLRRNLNKIIRNMKRKLWFPL